MYGDGLGGDGALAALEVVIQWRVGAARERKAMINRDRRGSLTGGYYYGEGS